MRTLKELIKIKNSLEVEQRELWLKLLDAFLEPNKDKEYKELRLRANKVDRKLYKFNRRIENL